MRPPVAAQALSKELDRVGVKFANMQRKLDEKRADLNRVGSKMHANLWDKAERRRDKERLRMRKLKCEAGRFQPKPADAAACALLHGAG